MIGIWPVKRHALAMHENFPAAKLHLADAPHEFQLKLSIWSSLFAVLAQNYDKIWIQMLPKSKRFT